MSIDSSAFKARREALLRKIEGGVLILGSAPLAIRNNDVEHEYRQDSDFYYLTGFEEPESVLILSTVHAEHRTILFVRPRDPEREQWDGDRAGIEGAKTIFGADEAYPISELRQRLPEYILNAEHLHYPLQRDHNLDRCVLEVLQTTRARARGGDTAPSSICDLGSTLHEMRLIKSDAEISTMRRAIEITRHAHHAAMRAAKPGAYEYELEAELIGTYLEMGCARPAYGSIVGAGANATVLHYRANRSRLNDGELVLIDAGCEWQYYASDITRVFPVNGRFSASQKALYECVLAAQQASIETIRPGATLEDVHKASVRKLTEGMIELKLIEASSVDDAMAQELYRPFYMHRTSHWLGMDVHDVGAYYQKRRPRLLQPGMVLTVEPGLYVPSNLEKPTPWSGIGIRIEDDVLVTESGFEVLSQSIPKSIQDVEKWMATPLD